jgi:5-methylcytosine-specific restriction endonuclease McrA
MKPYIKLYMDYFGYDTSDFIPCELCGAKAVDINHIFPRGMGGTKKKDVIENLVACCRDCHINKADRKIFRDEWIKKHNIKLNEFRSRNLEKNR